MARAVAPGVSFISLLRHRQSWSRVQRAGLALRTQLCDLGQSPGLSQLTLGRLIDKMRKMSHVTAEVHVVLQMYLLSIYLVHWALRKGQ